MQRGGLTGEARRAYGAAGITMVELLVAASVVLVTIIAIATVFPVAMSGIDLGGDETVAAALAQSFGDLIRNESFATITSYNGFNSNNAATCPATPASANANCMAYRAQVQGLLRNGGASVVVTSTVNTATNQSLATVVVTVSWRPRGESWLPFTPRRQVQYVTRRNA